MPKLIDHDKRREEILERCFDLFAEHGYAAMTMRKLASELGVSTGTLYHYFDGKPALFEAMFRWLHARDAAALAEGVAADATQAERLARLGEYITANQQHLQRTLRVALDFQRQHTDEASRAFVARTLRQYSAALQEQLELQDHPALTTVLLSFLLGLGVHGILDPDAVVVEHHLAVLGMAADAVAGHGDP